jgi:hypothetical protein
MPPYSTVSDWHGGHAQYPSLGKTTLWACRASDRGEVRGDAGDVGMVRFLTNRLASRLRGNDRFFRSALSV